MVRDTEDETGPQVYVEAWSPKGAALKRATDLSPTYDTLLEVTTLESGKTAGYAYLKKRRYHIIFEQRVLRIAEDQ